MRDVWISLALVVVFAALTYALLRCGVEPGPVPAAPLGASSAATTEPAGGLTEE